MGPRRLYVKQEFCQHGNRRPMINRTTITDMLTLEIRRIYIYPYMLHLVTVLLGITVILRYCRD